MEFYIGVKEMNSLLHRLDRLQTMGYGRRVVFIGNEKESGYLGFTLGDKSIHATQLAFTRALGDETIAVDFYSLRDLAKNWPGNVSLTGKVEDGHLHLCGSAARASLPLFDTTLKSLGLMELRSPSALYIFEPSEFRNVMVNALMFAERDEYSEFSDYALSTVRMKGKKDELVEVVTTNKHQLHFELLESYNGDEISLTLPARVIEAVADWVSILDDGQLALKVYALPEPAGKNRRERIGKFPSLACFRGTDFVIHFGVGHGTYFPSLKKILDTAKEFDFELFIPTKPLIEALALLEAVCPENCIVALAECLMILTAEDSGEKVEFRVEMEHEIAPTEFRINTGYFKRALQTLGDHVAIRVNLKTQMMILNESRHENHRQVIMLREKKEQS